MTTAYSGTTNVCPDCFEKFDYQGSKWDYIPENVFKEYIATGLYYNDQTNYFILTNIPTITPNMEGSDGYAIGVMNLFLPAVKNPLLPISKDVGINHKYIQENNGAITQTNTEFWFLLGGTRVGIAALKHIRNFVNRPPDRNLYFSRPSQDKMGKPKGNTPGNNQSQNKQVSDLARKYKLSKQQRRQLHDMISGEGYGYHEIEQVIKNFIIK
ncbi:hypothetical protein M2132_002223 [Dysgonomonas sp. PH5-45]|uniref:hypothetical protein n=1 Tax=unclassified Dysgonomonas TaxID=2630389 RepID=UPI002474DFA9|nr:MULTISPECIES: hypothetical protein [unclassified Dysgonomonas]MDH6355873.1 hypothetical protein [Dysgonomonas sp. PH5-45]MDH6388768.1 hypothetical protein [Dysgonomonas sp. PH5-37]